MDGPFAQHYQKTMNAHRGTLLLKYLYDYIDFFSAKI